MPESEPHHFSKTAEELIGDLRGIADEAPRRQKLRATSSLADVVDQLVTKYQIGRDAPEHIIRENWVQIVGTVNATYAHAARLENNGTMLIVIVPHSVVRNELFHHRASIMAKIKLLPGCRDVKFLKLTPG
jgi:hypothetical protein